MQRRSFRRPMSAMPRKKARYFWVRQSSNNVAPALLNTEDLLLSYRTAAGISLEIPEFTIWRIHIKITMKFTYSPLVYTSNSGMFIAMFVDDFGQLPGSAIVSAYDQQYLMWDFVYAAEEQLNANSGTGGTNVLYKQYDIKSHRKIRQLKDTLWLSIGANGNVIPTDYSFTHSTLLRLY